MPHVFLNIGTAFRITPLHCSPTTRGGCCRDPTTDIGLSLLNMTNVWPLYFNVCLSCDGCRWRLLSYHSLLRRSAMLLTVINQTERWKRGDRGRGIATGNVWRVEWLMYTSVYGGISDFVDTLSHPSSHHDDHFLPSMGSIIIVIASHSWFILITYCYINIEWAVTILLYVRQSIQFVSAKLWGIEIAQRDTRSHTSDHWNHNLKTTNLHQNSTLIGNETP